VAGRREASGATGRRQARAEGGRAGARARRARGERGWPAPGERGGHLQPW